MSEMGEVFKSWKQDRQEKRWSNYASSKNILIKEGIIFEEKDNGHFTIYGPDSKEVWFDFWATTGLYIHRQTKTRGRGVRGLIRKVKRV